MIIKKRTLLSLGLASLLNISTLISEPTLAQETDDSPITIINRDGEAVDSTQLGKAIEDKRIRPAQPALQRPGLRLRPLEFGAGAMFQNNNGTITIIDSDGERQEIDVQGARSVSVSHSSKVVVVDGVRKQEAVGKAIVVDADGERHEYTLAPPEAQADDPVAGDQVEIASKQFMIGVNCQSVSELLAAQLQLDPDTGLVVQAVSKGSPAAQAGIEKHDILMFAEDRELSKITDLNEVVNKAGMEGSQVSLTVIRGGKEIGIDVGVIERPVRPNPIAGFPDIPGLKFELRRALPPMIDDNFQARDMMIPEMRELDQQMNQLREQLRRQFENR